jgi:polyhydroxybutyrate depolymerase
MKKNIFFIAVLIVLANTSCVFAQRAKVLSVPKTINVNGIVRNYNVFVPTNLAKDKKVPLVLMFHGGKSNAINIEKYSKFSDLAEREKFIVVYPDGINENWNDGRGLTQTDDLGFIKLMLDSIVKEYNIDEQRIYSTGISNGAFFSNYLAAHFSGRFAAIAPVVGGIAEPFAPNFKPQEPVSVLVIQATGDPIFPFNGGGVKGNRGRAISTEKTLELWRNHNGTAKNSINGNLPDADKNDGCTVETYLWQNGKNGTEVKFYKEIGGGHGLAGKSQYLPKFVIGTICKDYDATEVIWEFFKNHPKK